MADILLVGCGYVGCVLGQQLAAGGHRVWGARRSPEKLPEQISGVAVDVTRPDTLKQLPDVDLVLYLTAANGRTDAHYEGAYVHGPSAVMQELAQRARPPKRFFFVSSTGVFGDFDGDWVDESMTPFPAHFAGRCMVQGEERVRAGSIPHSILRLSGIYGPGRTRLLKAAEKGGALEETMAGTWLNQIHLDDIVGAMAHVLLMPQPPEVLHLSDTAPEKRGELLRELAAMRGWVGPEIVPDATPGLRPPRGNKRVRATRLLEAGYRFQYPTWREGYAGL